MTTRRMQPRLPPHPHKSGSALAYQFFGHPLMRLTKRVAVSP